MTVTLAKRLFEDASSLASPQASKKLRVLAPVHTEQLTATNSNVKPGVAAALQQNLSTGSMRKRRHDTTAAAQEANSSGPVSPSAGSGKRVSLSGCEGVRPA